jgi:hypothetical protein
MVSSKFVSAPFLSTIVVLTIAVALTVMTSMSAQAQTFTVLHNFTGGADGEAPTAGLTPGGAGTFYGTASGDGLYGYGNVFKLVHHSGGWSLLPIYSFKNDYDGANPLSPVTIGPDGSLYGTTIGYYDGQGTLYKLQPLPTPPPSPLTPWQFTLLTTFTGANGDQPVYEPLIFDQAGNLYGTTQFGGGYGAEGTVWEASPSGSGWTETVLAALTLPSNGPYSNVVFDSAGNLYGTTGTGTYIFELSPNGSSWTTTIVHTFDQRHGSLAYGGLVRDQAGNLYGATSDGGPGSSGVAYELSPSSGGWTFQVIQYFDSPGQGVYGELTLDAAGNLYGVRYSGGAYGDGQLFELTPSDGSWIFTDLHDFTGSDGIFAIGAVVLDADGNIFGTSSDGGAYGKGTVWEYTP